MTDGKQSMTDIKQSVTDCSLSPRVFPANMRPVTLFWHFLDFSLKKMAFFIQKQLCLFHPWQNFFAWFPVEESGPICVNL